MKRAPRSRQRHDLYAKYHDYDSEISDLLGECGFNASAERIIFRALEHVRNKVSEPVSVEHLVNATGVEYRTLLRAFQRYLNVGPKHYLKLRQLNLARTALRRIPDAGHVRNVTGILGEHGVTELGRFAIEYKQLFGETPSETLASRTTIPVNGPALRASVQTATGTEKRQA